MEQSITYTIHEVADRLRVNANTVTEFCKSQSFFRTYQIGTSLRINKAEFDQWLGSDSVYLVNEISDILGNW